MCRTVDSEQDRSIFCALPGAIFRAVKLLVLNPGSWMLKGCVEQRTVISVGCVENTL
jgi:hypothetical protein